jgi:HEAT repeat protein
MMHNDEATRQVRSAIQKLWSLNDHERESGKNEILRLGDAAIDALILFLVELLEDLRPRFANHTEREGEAAVDRSLQGMKTQAVRETLRTLLINGRLMSDAIELLGRLKAEKAVPVLVRIMTGRNIFMGWGGPEMVALCRIGPASVPYLIALVEDARSWASQEWDLAVCMLTRDPQLARQAIPLPPVGDNGQEDAQDKDDEGYEDAIVRRTNAIRVRAVEVLGKIGDRRALPVLNGLLQEVGPGVAHAARDAIDAIENGPRAPEVLPEGFSRYRPATWDEEV